MHNAKGDVSLMNFSRERNYVSMILCGIQNKSCRPFTSLLMFLELQPHVLRKRV